jgi:hypothetical protein
MKALIEYTIRQRLRDVSTLTVTVEATALPGKTKILHVDQKNIANLQKIEVYEPSLWSFITLTNFSLFRFLRLGVPLKFKPKVQAMLSCR